MELSEYLRQDIIFFLDRQGAIRSSQDRSKSKIRAMDDEFGLFIQRDYSKELVNALSVNNEDLAKKIFIETEQAFDKAPEGSNEKEALRKILQELAVKIRLFASNESYQKNLTEIIRSLEKKGVFTREFLGASKDYLHRKIAAGGAEEDDSLKALRAIIKGAPVDHHLQALQQTNKPATGQEDSTKAIVREPVQQEADAKTLKENVVLHSETENAPVEKGLASVEASGSVGDADELKKLMSWGSSKPTNVVIVENNKPIEKLEASIDVEGMRAQIRNELSAELKSKQDEIEKLRTAHRSLQDQQQELIDKARDEAIKTFRSEQDKIKLEQEHKDEETKKRKKERAKNIKDTLKRLHMIETQVQSNLSENEVTIAMRRYKDMRDAYQNFHENDAVAAYWFDRLREIHEEIIYKKQDLNMLKEQNETKQKERAQEVRQRILSHIEAIQSKIKHEKILAATKEYQHIKQLFLNLEDSTNKNELFEQVLNTYHEIKEKQQELRQLSRIKLSAMKREGAQT